MHRKENPKDKHSILKLLNYHKNTISWLQKVQLKVIHMISTFLPKEKRNKSFSTWDIHGPKRLQVPLMNNFFQWNSLKKF